MRPVLLKVYGHIYPASPQLEQALVVALQGAIPDNDDIPLLEREGDMLRISFEGNVFPEEDVLAVFARYIAPEHQGKLDILDIDEWHMTRFLFSQGTIQRRSSPLNDVLAYSGH